MNLLTNITIWDVVLILVVAVQGTLASCIQRPQLKAFFLVLPFPFALAVLALGQPINVTNVMGLIVLLAYTYGVKLFHRQFHLPIVWAIFLSALGYCIVGAFLAGIIPKTNNAFLVVSVAVCVLASILHYAIPHVSEPNYQSSLPVWKKFTAIVVVLLVLVLIKLQLQGFMTVFPMMGVIIAYEARLSLYTVCRHIPVAMLTLAPMIVVIRVLQDRIGLEGALAAGLIVYLMVLPAFILPMWKKDNAMEKQGNINHG